MVGAIVATIVAAIREKKARSAAVQSMQSAPMMDMGGDESLDTFGSEQPGQFEFNVDSFK